jgi:nitroreductase
MKNHSTDLNFNILNTILDNRYSCRSFLNKAVSKKIISNLLNTAQKIPSWCNAQPWQVQIISGKYLKGLTSLTLQAAKNGMQNPDIDFPSSYLGVYKNRRRECAEQLYESVGIAMGDKVSSKKQMLKNFNFFKAPCVAVITTPKELGTYGVLDCGAYVTAFTLAATSLGLASIPQAALAGLSPILRDFLGIPDNRNIVCVISFGYADEQDNINKFRTTRANSKDVQQLDIN